MPKKLPVCPDCQRRMVHLYTRRGQRFSSHGYLCPLCNKAYRTTPIGLVGIETKTVDLKALDTYPDSTKRKVLFEFTIPEEPPLECPECHSKHVVKAGLSITRAGKKQRYQCRDCAHIFVPKKE